MNVNGPALVMTRENGLEPYNSIIAARLNTAEPSVVAISRIIRVTVTVCDYTRVDTLKHVTSDMIETYRMKSTLSELTVELQCQISV